VLYAYSTAAYSLAREAIESGLRCESLKLVILTSEVAATHMIETVVRAVGVPAVMEYGSVECGFLAGEYPDRLLRVRDDCARIETLPRPDGRYDIAVTVLGNPSFPLLRYLIGDTTDRPLIVPETGLSVLPGVCGRQSDILMTKSGGFVHPTPIVHILESDPAVRRFRARQLGDGSVHVMVETDAPRGAIDVTGIRKRLAGLVGFPITLEVVTELPQTAAAKHRLIISERAGTLVS
jgi:phenylacetate-coenzyme A ligase PaaK-like adenylate-forming protein